MADRDRRTRYRFPLNAELRFHVIRRGQGKPICGDGAVVNMGSKGLAFRTGLRVERGQRLAVSLAWPALLDNRCLLRLSLEGTIVRTEGSLVAVQIETYDFRTSGRGKAAVQDELAAVTRSIEPFLSACM